MFECRTAGGLETPPADPTLPLFLVSENYNPVENINDLGFLPEVYSPYYKNLNKDDVKFLRDKKIKIIPWTVNSYSDIAKILDLRVDGINTIIIIY